MRLHRHLGIIVAASLLSGCSAVDGVWSTLAGPNNNGMVIAVPTPKTAASPAPTAAAAPAAVPTPAAPTATGAPTSPATPAPAAASPASSGTAAAAADLPALRAELHRLEDELARQSAEIERLHQALDKVGAAESGGRKPLVVIRFRRQNVAYEDALYNAVSRALERRPGAVFDVVAVAPVASSSSQVAVNSRAAKRDAESVLHTLTDMGLPAERVALSATTSANVASNEVEIYVR
jgi:hypothetical protein